MIGITAAQLFTTGRLEVPGHALGPRPEAEPGLPDIYVVLLDAYPRADTLDNDFGYDNSPFLDGLRAEGFDVAEFGPIKLQLHGSHLDLDAGDVTDRIHRRTNVSWTQRAQQYLVVADLIDSATGSMPMRQQG